ncbi:PREDICTED: jerky protein homolog [Cyphomyrmex costatus]|uniref:jerky protein homolog n=1 Tax=Cyphomyrmex costatus TaxID=456900 RepID=UPI0008522E44|nr:PREDICTED: jerky protein homolog [Cyphomyrmex costatus]
MSLRLSWLKKPTFTILDKAVHIWFQELRMRSIPVSGSIIKAKALEIAKELNLQENFVASTGWLDKWKIRHGIRQLQVCGEKKCADIEAADKFKTALSKMIKNENITLAQIFNVDETGLYFKMLPTKQKKKNMERLDLNRVKIA